MLTKEQLMHGIRHLHIHWRVVGPYPGLNQKVAIDFRANLDHRYQKKIITQSYPKKIIRFLELNLKREGRNEHRKVIWVMVLTVERST